MNSLPTFECKPCGHKYHRQEQYQNHLRWCSEARKAKDPLAPRPGGGIKKSSKSTNKLASGPPHTSSSNTTILKGFTKVAGIHKGPEEKAKKKSDEPFDKATYGWDYYDPDKPTAERNPKVVDEIIEMWLEWENEDAEVDSVIDA